MQTLREALRSTEEPALVQRLRNDEVIRRVAALVQSGRLHLASPEEPARWPVFWYKGSAASDQKDAPLSSDDSAGQGQRHRQGTGRVETRLLGRPRGQRFRVAVRAPQRRAGRAHTRRRRPSQGRRLLAPRRLRRHPERHHRGHRQGRRRRRQASQRRTDPDRARLLGRGLPAHRWRRRLQSQRPGQRRGIRPHDPQQRRQDRRQVRRQR